MEDRLKMPPYITYKTKNISGPFAGVAILIKPGISHEVIQKPFYEDTIAVRIDTTTGPIILATCYHPPRLRHPPFNDLDWLADHHLPVYLLADLNCHHNTFDYHSRVTDPDDKARGEIFYNQWIKSHRLIRHGPSFPTYLNRTRDGTAPDIVLSNSKIYHNHHISPMDANSSDHLAIKFTISSKPILKKVKCEHLEKADWEGFTAALAQATKEFSTPSSLRDCDAATADAALVEVCDAVVTARKEFIPQVKVCTRPFIPTSLKFNRLTKVLNTLNYNYRTTTNPMVRAHVQKQKTSINDMLRHEGRLLLDEHWLNLIKDALSYLTKDPKKYWKKLKRLRGKTKGTMRLTHNGLPDGTPLINDLDKERSLRENFAPRYAGTNEDRLADESVEEMDRFFADNPDILQPYPTADFTRLDARCPYTKLVAPPEVYDIIHHGQSKAPGEKGNTKEHLRHIPKILLVRLAHIFSAFLALGSFPDSMKCALMVFIHKPGKPKCDPSSYRPISLLPVLGKIFDKILTDRFTQYLDDNNLHHPHQYGFRRGRGTVSALSMSYEWIARQKAKHNSRITMVARDIKGAFDYLPHKRIQFHMARVGTPLPLLKSLSNFLEGRFAKVKVGSVVGEKFPLNAGTPQGATPSSIMFNLAISGMPIPMNNKHYWSSYADDTSQLVMTQQKRAGANYHGFAVSRAINELNEFERREGLITEPAKSWIMPIGNMYPPYVCVDDHEYKMPPDRVGKLLGHHFTWNSMVGKQASTQAARANAVVNSLWRFKRAPTKMKVHVVKTMVLPYLTYPCVPLHTANDSVMGELQAAQNNALRYAFDVAWFDFVSSEKLHNRFKHKFQPLNQVLHWRAKKTWENISCGQAGELSQYNVLVDDLAPEPDEPYHPNFPSSLEMANGPEPPPLYTYRGNRDRTDDVNGRGRPPEQ